MSTIHPWALVATVCATSLAAHAEGLARFVASSTHIGVFEIGDELYSEEDTHVHELTLVELLYGPSDLGSDPVVLWHQHGGVCPPTGIGTVLEEEESYVLMLKRRSDIDPELLDLDEGVDLFTAVWVSGDDLAESVEGYADDLQLDPEDRYHSLLVRAESGTVALQQAAAEDLASASEGVTPYTADVELLEDTLCELDIDDPRLQGLLASAMGIGAGTVALDVAFSLVAAPDERLPKLLAIEVVREFGSSGTAAALAEALDEEDVDRGAIIMALGELADEAGRAAIEAEVRSGDRDTQILGLFSLGQIADPASVWHATLLAQSPDPSVATAALYCLGRLGEQEDETAAALLAELGSDWENETIRARAAIAAGNPGWMQVIFEW